MESNYLFRALSNYEEELLKRNELTEIKPRNKNYEKYYNEWEPSKLRNWVKSHIVKKDSYDVLDICVSLTASISVATYCSKFNESCNSIVLIDKRKLDENRLYDMSTYTQYCDNDTYGVLNDNRHDGFADKFKEYDYIGSIKDFLVLPKWLAEYILEIRNVRDFAESEYINHKKRLLDEYSSTENKKKLHEYYLFNIMSNIEKIKELIRDSPEILEHIQYLDHLYRDLRICNFLYKLLYLYKNDNYLDSENLYNKNLYLILNFNTKECLKNTKLEDIQEQLFYILQCLDENSKTIQRRKNIEIILDDYIDRESEIYPPNFLKGVLEKIFYYEYYIKNKSLREIYDLFVQEGFIYTSESRSVCILIEFIRSLVLNQLSCIFGNKKVSILETNILCKCYEGKPIPYYKDYLKLANINTKGFEEKKCIVEHMEMCKDITFKIRVTFPKEFNEQCLVSLDTKITKLCFSENTIEINWTNVNKYYLMNCRLE